MAQTQAVLAVRKMQTGNSQDIPHASTGSSSARFFLLAEGYPFHVMPMLGSVITVADRFLDRKLDQKSSKASCRKALDFPGRWLMISGRMTWASGVRSGISWISLGR